MTEQTSETDPKAHTSRTHHTTALLAAGVAVVALVVSLSSPAGNKQADDPRPPQQPAPTAEISTDQVINALRTKPEAALEALNTAGALDARLQQNLMENPETILDSLDAYRAEMEQEANKPITGDLQATLEDPEQGHLLHVGGPEKAPVTIVKFHDDNCGYCRRAISTIERLVAERDDVAVYVRPFPVLGQDSRAAAEVGVALADQDLYVPYYKRQDDEDVKQLSREGALAIADELGADMEKIQRDMDAGAVSAGLTEDLELGREAGVQGTPTFFVGSGDTGTKRVRGAVPYEAMVDEVEAALARLAESE